MKSLKKIYITNIIIIGICTAIAFFFITINSKNSFLYSFNNNADMHCFLTTSRCMLRGDVLYRDVYEHRGTMNCLIYCAALLISDNSVTGVYIIEILFFSVFLFYVDKTIGIFFKGRMPRFLIVLFTGLFASSLPSFYGGGESEEFVLPFLMIPVYIVIKNFHYAPNKKISFKDTAVVGVCFAEVFWIKYTLSGLFIGIAAAIIIICLRTGHKKFIVNYCWQFTAGFIIGSIPVIIYHIVTHSFYDLWEVYFYSLIFRYGSEAAASNNSFFFKLLTMWPFFILYLSSVIFMPRKTLSSTISMAFILMFAGEALGIASAYLWTYSFEPLFVFLPVSLSFFFIIVDKRIVSNNKLKEKNKKIIDGFKEDYLKTPTKNNLIIIISSVLCVCISSFFLSESFGYRRFKKSDYPQYKISRYIQEHSAVSPVIINYRCLDQGVYWLTGTYPPNKYYCSYNMETDEIMSVYDEYIYGQKS